MKKQIRLTETELHNVIEGKVNRMINEISYKRMKKVYDKLRKQGRHAEADAMNKTYQDMYGGKVGNAGDGRGMYRDISLSDKDQFPYWDKEDAIEAHRGEIGYNSPLRNRVSVNGNNVVVNGGYQESDRYKRGERSKNPYRYGDENSYLDDMADEADKMNQWKKGKVDSRDMRTDIAAESITKSIMRSLDECFAR